MSSHQNTESSLDSINIFRGLSRFEALYVPTYIPLQGQNRNKRV